MKTPRFYILLMVAFVLSLGIQSCNTGCKDGCECVCPETSSTQSSNKADDPHSSPEAIVRAFVKASVAKDCNLLATYFAADNRDCYEIEICGPYSSARIDEVIIRDGSRVIAGTKQVTLIGEFQLRISEITADTVHEYVEEINGKWYVVP